MAIEPPSRLRRALGLGDAVVMGLASMLGAGIFVGLDRVLGLVSSWPALLVSVLVAASVAMLSGLSSAQLAAVHPVSGGTYAYARARLGEGWGWLAGWMFLVAKIASCAALARTFAGYALPESEFHTFGPWIAIGLVGFCTAVNLMGIRIAARVTRVLVTFVVVSLLLVLVGTVGWGSPPPGVRFSPTGTAVGHLIEVFRAAMFAFFAFAGFARISTLGEEVRDPGRTIARAIPIAIGVVAVLYGVVALSVHSVGLPTWSSAGPLANVVQETRYPQLAPFVRAGAIVATAMVLLSLIAGVSRTVFAMAADHEMPRSLARVHERSRVPHVALLVTGIAAGSVAFFVDVRISIGLSAFTILAYYAITNACALRLTDDERRWPRAQAWLGMTACTGMLFALSYEALWAPVIVAGGWLAYRLRRALSRG